MTHHHDPGDAFRVALLSRILDVMAASSDEDVRVRNIARSLVDKMRRERLAGERFLARWDRLLGLPLVELQEALLGDHDDASELRHAHPFAGVLSARELNKLRTELRASQGRTAA